MSVDFEIQEFDHSELGPSASERWLECPGSVLLTRGVDNPTSVFAAEGNAAHELSEWCRVQGKPAEHWRGKILKVDQFEFEVDQEMIDGVNSYVEFCEQWPGETLCEVRVDYGQWVPGGFGTLDDARLTDGVARVTDLKFGKGVQVWAEDNPQLRLYALGLYQDYQYLYDFDRFVLTIHQPRLNHVDTTEIQLPELLEWANDVVKPIAKQALEPNAPLKAGDHCRFCPIRQTCKVRMKFVTEKVFDDFDNLDETPRDLLFLTNEEIAIILPRLANIKKWCSDLETHVISEIGKGQTIGDYKLVEGRSIRQWKPDSKKALAALEDLWEYKLMSPAQAEKKVGKGKLDEHIFKPPGSPTLVPGSDKRPSLAFKAENEFDNLEEES